ncbi:MAG TPA: hypothetical protein VJP41_01170 [Gaiellaceae bacterium]|nr:hypothetical protein [Gaiellaceae bacterium]
MTDSLDQALSERFALQHDKLPMPDFADVLRRATRLSSSESRPKAEPGVRKLGLRSWRRRSVVLVAVAALAAVGAASAVAYHYLGPSPGFTAGLSSLNKLPPVPWPSSVPEGGLANEAASTGLTPAQAEQRMRLAQSGLSLGQGDVGDIDLYAFPGESGSACLFVTAPLSGGICLPTSNVSNPALDGVAWAAWGGDGPKTPTGPLGVFGLVADNVTGVEADISGTTRSIPIVNNSFYADYDQITSKDSIKLIVRFDDGTTRTLTAPNPYGDNGPIHILPYTPTQIPNPPTAGNP